MSESVVYEQLDPADPAAAVAPSDADLRRLSDVPMEASVEIGRTTMTVGETLQLHAGAVVLLERLAGEPADLLVNGTLIARGEIVVVDEQFGLRVSEIVEDELDGAAALGTGASNGNPSAADHAVQGAAGDGQSAAEGPVDEAIADTPPSEQRLSAGDGPAGDGPAAPEDASSQEQGAEASGGDDGAAEHGQGEEQ